jgi:hypothetical protein
MFSVHSRTAEPRSCERAFDTVQRVAQHEPRWDYAREVLVEGRRAFVRDCERFLTPAQVRCVLRSTSSGDLYSCT